MNRSTTVLRRRPWTLRIIMNIQIYIYICPNAGAPSTGKLRRGARSTRGAFHATRQGLIALVLMSAVYPRFAVGMRDDRARPVVSLTPDRQIDSDLRLYRRVALVFTDHNYTVRVNRRGPVQYRE